MKSIKRQICRDVRIPKQVYDFLRTTQVHTQVWHQVYNPVWDITHGRIFNPIRIEFNRTLKDNSWNAAKIHWAALGSPALFWSA